MPELPEGPWSNQWKGFALSLGKGGQGSVYKVVNRANGDIGVLKKLIPSKEGDLKARERMYRESEILRRFQFRPNLPHLLDSNCDEFEETSIHLYFVSSFIGGITLDRYLATQKLMLPDQAVWMTIKLLEIVSWLHSLDWPIFHRDIKPENVLVNAKNEPVLIDFGIAYSNRPLSPKGEASLEDDQEDIRYLTSTDEAVGPQFLVLPERFSNQRDPRNDVAYCCGILFYLITGEKPNTVKQPPHRSSDLKEILGRLHPDDRAALESVFDRGFQKKIENRFQSAQELKVTLELVLNELKVVTPARALSRSSLAQFALVEKNIAERLSSEQERLNNNLLRLAEFAKISDSELENMTFLDALEACKRVERFRGDFLIEESVYSHIHDFIVNLQDSKPAQDEYFLTWYPAVNNYLESRINDHTDLLADMYHDMLKDSE